MNDLKQALPKEDLAKDLVEAKVAYHVTNVISSSVFNQI